MKRWFIKKLNKGLLEEMDKINVSKKALYKYKRYVGDNYNETDKKAISKLKRNFLVGEHIHTNNDGTFTVRYGNLYISGLSYKDGTVEINEIYNQKGKGTQFNIDNKLKNKIDNLIEIGII